MIRLSYALAIFCLIFGLAKPVLASHDDSVVVHDWAEINKMTDDVWELGKVERYDEAVVVLEYALNHMTHLKDVKELNPDQQRMVQFTFQDAVDALNHSNVTKEYKMNKLTEVRLLVDALQTEYDPLWKKTGLMMLEPFIEMKKGIGVHDSPAFHQAANLLLERYETVRPALSVDLSEDKLKLLDQHVSFVDKNRNTILQNATDQQQFNVAMADFEALFMAKKDTSEPSIFWLIFSIGGIISSTLVYVGWRKYKGDKEDLRVPDKRA